MFCALSQNCQRFCLEKVYILKQIVQGTLHWYLSRPRGFEVMDQTVKKLFLLTQEPLGLFEC